MDSVKIKLSILLLTLLTCTQIFGQDFTGFVKKDDTTLAPIYQANVEILQGGHTISTLKTYFDGSFKFTPVKSQAYTVKISYPGYADTSYSVTTDKKANPTPATVTVKLRKDGMRLMGDVRSADENFPIKDVTVVLKNVMTRQEDRQTTGIDGHYNFKLDYETNYRLSIDKRSTGVFNKYRDTTFYVSTIGFNLPLDYKLDILLTKDLTQHTEMPSGYNASRVTASKDLKPVVPVSNGQPVTSIAVGKHVYTTAKALDPKEAQAQKEAQDAESKKQAALENDQLWQEQIRIAHEEIAKKEHDDSIMKRQIAARKKEVRDSIGKALQTAKLKALQDSAYEANVLQYHKIAEAAEKEARRDSASKVKAAEMRQLAAKKASADSINRLQANARQKNVQDSLMAVHMEQKLNAQEVAAKKAYRDSMNTALAEAQQRLVLDSISHAKREMLAAANARASQKAYADSVSKVLLAAHKKIERDSIYQMKFEKEKAAKELALKKAHQD